MGKRETDGHSALKEHPKPQYGYYYLHLLLSFSVFVVLTGVAVMLWFWWPIGLFLIVFGVILILGYVADMRLNKQSKSFEVQSLLEVEGDETVLDVGCGLGKMTIGVAKKLKTGKVIGVDIWDQSAIKGNTAEMAYKNAKIEGVADKVKFRTGNVFALPFDNESFDLVTSAQVLYRMRNADDKLQALREIFRILHPNGKFLLIEPLRDLNGIIYRPLVFLSFGISKEKWIKLLENAGFRNIEYKQSYNKMGAFLAKKLG